MLLTSSCEPITAARRGSAPREWYQTQTGHAAAQPAIAGDLVFVGTGDGHVVARDRDSGAQRWAARVGTARIEGANLVARSGVVVAPVLFHTAGLDAATGAELWRYRAPADTVDGGQPNPGSVGSAHVDADDSTAYVPAWGGTIAAVALRSGELRWRWQPEPGIPHRFGAQGVRVSEGTVYATVWHFLNARGTACEGWVVALDARTGRERWRTVLPTPSSAVCIPGRPALASGRVFAMLITGELFALDQSTGKVAWSVPRERGVFNSVIAGPASVDGVVYADAGTHHLRAFDANTGRMLWRAPYAGQFKHDLLVTDRRIYGPDGSELYVFDRRTGVVRKVLEQPRQKPSFSLFSATPASADGQVIVPVNGGVWAFPER
ncbi:MAG: PQQ-binding-like beta-propeller repeat protein [Gemmatimonadota bacterium]|nr:PQQ-binding-like beta-propeller repeat protein [Gemmatimonadota bacterium]